MIYGINFEPELTGAGKFTGELARHLARQHEVSVVCAPPYYPNWVIDPNYGRNRYSVEREKNFIIHRCPIWVRRRMGFTARILHLLSFSISSFPIVLYNFLFRRPNVVLAIVPTFVSFPGVVVLSRAFGIPSWLHIQDLELDAMLGLQNNASGWCKFALWTESNFMKLASARSSISKAMCQKVEYKSGRCHLFPNGVDLKHFSPQFEDLEATRKRFELQAQDHVVLYSGNIGLKQGLDLLPALAEKVAQKSHTIFVIIGDGIYLPELKKEIEQRNLENVVFFPLQPYAQLPAILSMANLHLILQKVEVSDLVLPSKLTAILSIGGTALITCPEESEMGSMISENPGVAIRLNPGDVTGLEDAIVEDAHRKKLEMNAAARAYAEQHLDCEVIHQSFSEALQGLCR